MDHEVREQLLALEPIFHHAAVGAGREVFEAMTSADYWEVGASGRVYTRDFVIDTLVDRYISPHEDAWAINDFEVRQLAERVWLATYELDQDGQLSRRATVWRRSESGWIAQYHQGTFRRPAEQQISDVP